MKLLAFADTHLGASPDLGTAASPRLRDQEQTLKQIADLAIAEQVDGILFAGDVVHHRRPSPPVLYAWRAFVEAVGDEGIPVVAVAGNHDVAAVDEWTAPEIVRGSAYYAFHRRPIVDYAIDGVAVACLPWAPISNLVASRNGGSRDVLHEEAAALLVQTARGLRHEVMEGRAALLLCHFSISGAVTPTGREVGPDFGVVLPCDELERLGFDFVVAGHIHEAQMLGSEDAPGPIFYTGSPGVVDWGEAETEHGVWILDTETWGLDFRPLKDRPFATFSIDAETAMGWDDIEDFAGITDLDGAVVRLRYTATADQARRIDLAAIRAALHAAGAARVFIQPTIVREERARVEGVDETLGPIEALDLYCEHHSINGDRQAAMAERTTRYLQEV